MAVGSGGYTREEANDPLCAMPPRIDELTAIFDKNWRYREFGGDVCAEKEFSIGIWNGWEEPYVTGLSIDAGLYGDNRSVPNQPGWEFQNAVSRRGAHGPAAT